MPDLLELAFQVDQYKALPVSGGLYDQPAGLMRKLRQVLNVYQAVKLEKEHGRKPGEMAKWRSENQHTWNIVLDISELRQSYGR